MSGKRGWDNKPPLDRDEMTGFDVTCWFIGFVAIWVGGLMAGAAIMATSLKLLSGCIR